MKSFHNYKSIKSNIKVKKMYMKFIPNFIYRVYVKIERIISYLPILWKDEDWDWHFILRILSHKLNRTRECIIRNDIIVEEDQKIIDKSIRIILKLFKRIEDEEYSDWLDSHVQNKWAQNYHLYLFKRSVLDDIMGYEIPVDRDTKFNEEQLKEMKNDRLECHKAGERMQTRDLNRAMRIFEKYLRFWWD